MTKPVAMALPVPPVGTALDGSGEAYVASLAIAVKGDDGTVVATTSGDVVEMLLIGLNMRRAGFHPRTFAFSAFTIDAAKAATSIGRNWSAMDAAGPAVMALADHIVDLAKSSGRVSFEQIN